MFLNCSTCFGRQPSQQLATKTSVKPEAAITVLELLMMVGVLPETCWAIKKHWNNKFYYTVASCWFFLWDLYYDARIHEYQDNFLAAVGIMRVWTEVSLFSGSPLVSAEFVLQVNMLQFHSITHYEKSIETNTEKYCVYEKSKLS